MGSGIALSVSSETCSGKSAAGAAAVIFADLAVGQQAEVSQEFFGCFHDARAIGTMFCRPKLKAGRNIRRTASVIDMVPKCQPHERARTPEIDSSCSAKKPLGRH
jgi:hypothetical protein